MDFVRASLAAGKSREDIRSALETAGWRHDEITDALSRFAELDFPVPVPKRRTFSGARDAFLSLITFGALYTGASALGALLFGLIDHYLPDPLERSYDSYQSSNDSLRWCVAAMAVAFPIYFFFAAKHYKEFASDPERRTSKVRLWLTYLTITVVAFVIMGDLIDLIGHVLGGEYASRFLLKVATVFVISGIILAFYLWDMRRVARGTDK